MVSMIGETYYADFGVTATAWIFMKGFHVHVLLIIFRI